MPDGESPATGTDTLEAMRVFFHDFYADNPNWDVEKIERTALLMAGYLDGADALASELVADPMALDVQRPENGS